MIRAYVIDRISWIALFAGSLLLTDLLLFVDQGIAISLVSIGYLNGLLILLFGLFFAWRYWKETAYLRELSGLVAEVSEDWLESLPKPVFMQDQMLYDLLRKIDAHQVERMASLQEFMRAGQNDTAAWVHEVKAPITAMKLIIDAERSAPAVRKIEAEWLRIHLLIDQQLYISRLPSLESDYVIEEADAIRLAAAEVRQLMPWYVEKNIAVDIEGDQAAVITDRKWCRFIIRQLLTNAVKYSPDGGTVTIDASADSSGRLTLSIADEGPGIGAHELPRIFDKGFTGEAGRIYNAATGLGLYLAQQTAHKVGIHLHAESDGVSGTRMLVTFPEENEFDATRK